MGGEWGHNTSCSLPTLLTHPDLALLPPPPPHTHIVLLPLLPLPPPQIREDGGVEALVAVMSHTPLNTVVMEHAMGTLHNVMITGVCEHGSEGAGACTGQWARCTT